PDGMCLGSMGVGLVLESAGHAAARGVRPVARLAEVAHGWSTRQPGAAAAAAGAFWNLPRDPEPVLVLSGACGAGPITAEEKAFLATRDARGPELAIRGTSAAIGHGVEASFPANLALAAWLAETGAAVSPLSADPI